MPSAKTCGAGAWTFTKYQDNKIAVAQRSIERSLLSIPRKYTMRNEEIRMITGVTYILYKAAVSLCLFVCLSLCLTPPFFDTTLGPQPNLAHIFG